MSKPECELNAKAQNPNECKGAKFRCQVIKSKISKKEQHCLEKALLIL